MRITWCHLSDSQPILSQFILLKTLLKCLVLLILINTQISQIFFSFLFFNHFQCDWIPTFTTLSIHGIYMWWNTTKFEYFGFANHNRQERSNQQGLDSHSPNASMLFLFLLVHRDANDQKFSRKEGKAANQLMKDMHVAVWNSTQWFCPQTPRSLSIRTVMPADAQAAANVRVDVIPSPMVNRLTTW